MNHRKPIPGLGNLPLLGSLEFELDPTDTPDTARSRVSMHLRNEARRQGLTSRTGARGLTQFMDATARDLETRYPDLALLARASPRWAFRAQSLYLHDLYNSIDIHRDSCERMGFALQSYVGGRRWVLERQRLSTDQDVCLYMTCRINPGILPSNQREASEYPERIIDRWTPLYLSWGKGACW